MPVCRMRYVDHPVPAALSGWVAGLWSLTGDGDGDTWITHEATPDGCLELIRRHRGHSEWRRPQPDRFVTGLSERPIAFRFTADADFTGVKLWPWTWTALGGAPCPVFRDDWLAVSPESPLDRVLDDDPLTALATILGPPPPIGAALAAASGVTDLAARFGWSIRTQQRWFADIVGIPPRRYLRLLRFRDTLLNLQTDDAPLAQAAAAGGYADQAHMARDFGRLAGMPPSAARHRARGPFV